RTTYLYQQKPTNIIATNLLLQTGKAGNEYIIAGDNLLGFSSDAAWAAHWNVQLNPEHEHFQADKYYFIYWSEDPDSERLYLCLHENHVGVDSHIEAAQSWRILGGGGIYDDFTEHGQGRLLGENNSGNITVGEPGSTILLHNPSTGNVWDPLASG
ncbi:hypothetical protein ACIQ9Q_43335, partial [Streptomyces sp. NPDC094438]|uniref:hypothetical protein n=1 Tax=Streptomyces sp. NPDC094438 TaxID=3366061 RepID=UPI0038253304